MNQESSTQNRRVWIGNDHGGYELKRHIVNHLKSKGLSLEDVGSDSTDIVRYPHYANLVAQAIQGGSADCGILICSTGIGMSIIANRFPGIRAALCTSTYMGRMTKAHNNANILCLGGKITETSEALDIVDAWLEADYEGGRHDISLGLITETEAAIAASGCGLPVFKPIAKNEGES